MILNKNTRKHLARSRRRLLKYERYRQDLISDKLDELLIELRRTDTDNQSVWQDLRCGVFLGSMEDTVYTDRESILVKVVYQINPFDGNGVAYYVNGSRIGSQYL